MNTRFSYMYRDAANYKSFYEFVFEGKLSDAQKQAFVDACNDEYFIPRALGLPGGVLVGEDGYDEAYDHYWCEHDFEDSFDAVFDEPTVFNINGKHTVIKIEEFLELFTRCSEGWEAALTRPIDVFSIRSEVAIALVDNELLNCWVEELLKNNNKTLLEDLSSEELQAEIEDVKGTISNEKMWAKADSIHEENIVNLNEYLSLLEECLQSNCKVSLSEQIESASNRIAEIPCNNDSPVKETPPER